MNEPKLFFGNNTKYLTLAIWFIDSRVTILTASQKEEGQAYD